MALHFATPSRRGGNQSDDGALGSAWIGRETEGGVDFLLVGFGAAGFAEMDSPTVSALQGGGDPDLVRQGVTNGVPGVVDALGFELQADGMHGAVGRAVQFCGVGSVGTYSESGENPLMPKTSLPRSVKM